MNELNDATKKVIVSEVSEDLERAKDIEDFSAFRKEYASVLEEIGMAEESKYFDNKAQRKILGCLYKDALRVAKNIGIFPITRDGVIQYEFLTDDMADIEWYLGGYEIIGKKYGIPKERLGRARNLITKTIEKRKNHYIDLHKAFSGETKNSNGNDKTENENRGGK